MGEGVLKRREQRPQEFVLVALAPGAARITDRHHEHVRGRRTGRELHPHLAPIEDFH
jgi:hypothetical protein